MRPRRMGAPLKRALPTLTRREAAVLELVAADCANREIAAKLQVSEQAVTYHVGNLLTKFEARSRTGLVSKGFVLGYLLTGSWPPPLAERIE